jgi:hypothetical protein
LNNDSSADFKIIAETTKNDQQILSKKLQSFLKLKILSCNKPASKLQEGVFSINKAFYNQKAIIADNWTVSSEPIEGIKKNRSLALQALGAKIMKKNRIMKVQQLKDEIAKEASFLFAASPEDIAHALTILETNGYIERH